MPKKSDYVHNVKQTRFMCTDRVNSKHIRATRINAGHSWAQLKMVIIIKCFVSEIKQKNDQNGKRQSTTLKPARVQRTYSQGP